MRDFIPDERRYANVQLGFEFVDNPPEPREIKELGGCVDPLMTESYIVIENLYALNALVWETNNDEIAMASLKVLQEPLISRTCEEYPGIADLVIEQIQNCCYQHPRTRLRKYARYIIREKMKLIKRFSSSRR